MHILLTAAEEELAALAMEDSLEGQVRIRIAEQMQQGTQDGVQIAKSLGMSVSTLRRRLRQEGKGLRQIRDDVFRDLATRALADSSANISSISRELGYSVNRRRSTAGVLRGGDADGRGAQDVGG